MWTNTHDSAAVTGIEFPQNDGVFPRMDQKLGRCEEAEKAGSSSFLNREMRESAWNKAFRGFPVGTKITRPSVEDHAARRRLSEEQAAAISASARASSELMTASPG